MLSSNSKPSLFLFTLQYPYGTGETFIDNEIKAISHHFDLIYVFPLTVSGIARSVESNVQIVDWQKNYTYSSGRALKKHFFSFIKIFFFEFEKCSFKFKMMQNFSEMRNLLLQNLERSEYITKCINGLSIGSPVYYSYWFEDWSTVLSICKNKGTIQHFFSRAHGFDVYSERRKSGFIPFRNFQMEYVDKVFVVSNIGVQYLKRQNPDNKNKIELSRLGVFDHGINPKDENKVFTLVSCSNLVPVKRIHLIVEILKEVGIELNWVHFGAGELFNELMDQVRVLPPNISVNFKGQLSNDKILEFYQTNSVDLFINVSASEGIPVSVMEAISFGIPVIATNVGGTSEIVNARTGILIDSQFETNNIAEIIDSFHLSHLSKPEFRSGVREFWNEHYNALKNYNYFWDQILFENSNN